MRPLKQPELCEVEKQSTKTQIVVCSAAPIAKCFHRFPGSEFFNTHSR